MSTLYYHAVTAGDICPECGEILARGVSDVMTTKEWEERTEPIQFYDKCFKCGFKREIKGPSARVK